MERQPEAIGNIRVSICSGRGRDCLILLRISPIISFVLLLFALPFLFLTRDNVQFALPVESSLLDECNPQAISSEIDK